MTYELENRVLDLATLAGKVMLESGGEIYRVEDTIAHICAAFGFPECDSYASPTSIVVSLTNGEYQTSTRVRRIVSRGVNMDRVEAVNSFSRNLKKTEPSPENLSNAEKQIRAIQHSKEYPLSLITLASGVGTGSFAIIFGGGILDFLVGFFIGCLVRLVIYTLAKKGMRDFLVNAVGGAACALLCWLAHVAGLPVQWLLLTLSSLMLLTPGMRLTNAFRDIASGDFVAGMSLLLETFSIAVALACGAMLVYAPLLLNGGLAI